MRHTLTQVLVVGFLASGCVWAQEQEDTGRGVARVSLINGDVSIQRGDSGDWVAAAVNAPLVALDHVLTGVGSRGEIQFDWAHMLRLSSDTEVRIAELENRRYQVQVARGTVTLSVLRDSDADMEVDTPNISVRPVKRGSFRLTVADDGQSEITVRSGEAEAFTPTGVEHLNSGNTMLVRGPADNPEFQRVRALETDNWDRWNEDRDHQLSRARSYEYVSRDIYGADDLDAYGRWINLPGYGWVWSPNGVGPDWAPYRSGRWAWEDYYGWTWIGYEPWGWAPYHYGRWFFGPGYGWCWYPGPIRARHFWSPGLVAFFGYGGGVGVGIGFGSIGWVPLAPYEPYYPWYGRGYYGGFRNGSYANVRIVNNVNITNVYRNARVTNGVSGLDAGVFTRGGAGRPIGVHDGQFHLVQGQVPLAPGVESTRFSDRELRMTNMPRRTGQERFAMHNQPVAVDRVSFDQQRRGMEQVVGRTFGAPAGQAAGAGAQSGNSGPAWRQTTQAPEHAVTPNERNGAPGWRRTGEPSTSSGAYAPSRTSQQSNDAGQTRVERIEPRTSDQGNGSNGNWRRFGRGSANNPAPSERNAPPPTRTGGTAGTDRTTAPPARNDVRATGGAGENVRVFGGGAAPTPRSETRSEPRTGAPKPNQFQSAEPLRINPPIVRERAPGGGGNSNGGGRAPAYTGPRGGGARVEGGGNQGNGGRGGGDRGGARR